MSTSTKQRAAKLLGYEVKCIRKAVEWTDLGTCSVALKNGNTIIIPHEVWQLGWTEEEYISWRRDKK